MYSIESATATFNILTGRHFVSLFNAWKEQYRFKMCLIVLYRIFDSLVVQCWLRVRAVPGSIPSQGPRHTKDVIKWYQQFPCLALNIKREILALSQELRQENKCNWIKSGMENPSKSEVIVRCGGDEKTRMTTQNRQKSNANLKKNRFYTIASVLNDKFYL